MKDKGKGKDGKKHRKKKEKTKGVSAHNNKTQTGNPGLGL